MLKRLNYSDPDFYSRLDQLLYRDIEENDAVEDQVRSIIKDIQIDGDDALLEYTKQLDNNHKPSIDELELSSSAITACYKRTNEGLIHSLESAAERIRTFHEKEKLKSWEYTEQDGTVLGQVITPVDKVGVYVPGGKAAYPSSVLMTAIPAKVAGVEEIIMTVPAPCGVINDTVIASAAIAGVDRIFTVGGAQAIAALAYGTNTIPKVNKIVGPGNIFVATAKKMVFGDVGIDMIAGPSEVVVICDELANPDWVTMDLFAQAEHDELAQSIVITISEGMAEKILQSVESQLEKMERKQIIQTSLRKNGAIIEVKNLDQAAELSNLIAPEHLELMLDRPSEIMTKIKHAGAIFVGKYSAEVFGDYCAGPNHVLPTAGTAKFSSPLGVYDFQKRSSIVQVSEQGANKMAEIASVLAASEGLTAHQQSARYRLKS